MTRRFVLKHINKLGSGIHLVESSVDLMTLSPADTVQMCRDLGIWFQPKQGEWIDVFEIRNAHFKQWKA